MAESVRSVESILFEAAEIADEEQRRKFIDEVCAGNAARRRDVERLLAAHFQAGSFLKPLLDLSATLEAPPIAERPGSVIGPYKLLEQIGEGGMGVVYMAEQQRPVRRKVALKIIKPGMDTRQVIARFEAERQALALMDHPNIAHVLDAGSTESGRPYFVMELVRGVPITEYCDKNKVNTEERLRLFVDVCRAVQHAHQKGIIHRDIKPSNVLVTLHDGVPVPKIIDFGVAKATNQQLTQRTLFTAFAQMVGTPLYMSPEQAEMSGLDVDTRSDIYSLGVMLYELLTGTTPFDRKRIHTAAYDEIRRIIREEEPPKPSTQVSTLGEKAGAICAQRRTDPKHLRQMLRGELDWIVMKTLEKDRTRRYDTASDLAADVQRYLAGEAVHAFPPSTAYRIRKLVRRHKKPFAVACGFLLLLLASSAVAWGLFLQTRRARNQLAEAAAILQRERDEANTLRKIALDRKTAAEQATAQVSQKAEELRRQLYDYNVFKADRAIGERNHQEVQSLLAACPEDLRRWEWRRLRLLADQSWRTIATPGVDTFQGDLSSDGRTAALVSRDAQLYVYDIPRGVELWRRKTGNTLAIRARFSPDGRQIVTCGFAGPFERPTSGLVQIWDARTSAELWKFEAEQEAFGDVKFTLDGRRLLAVGGKLVSFTPAVDITGRVRLWDVRTRELLWEFARAGEAYGAVEIGPQGDFAVALAGSNPNNLHTLRRWNFQSSDDDAVEGTEAWAVEIDSANVPTLAFDRDGARLVTAGGPGVLEVRDTATGRALGTLAPQLVDGSAFSRSDASEILAAAFDPSGNQVVSCTMAGEVRLWDVASQELTAVLSGHTGVVGMVGFTPDGEQIISAGEGALKLWSREPRQEKLTIKSHTDLVKAVAFTRDSRQVISAGVDGLLCWSDAVTGQLMRSVGRDDSYLLTVAVSHDGKTVAAGGQSSVSLREADSGRLRRKLPRVGETWCVAFSPDDQFVAAGGRSGVLKCWNTATGEEPVAFETLPNAGYLDGLDFSHDGRRLVAVYHAGGLLVWNAETGKVAHELHPLMEAPSVRVRGVARSPQPPLFAVGIGQTVEVWDIEKPRLVRTLRGHNADVYCLTYSPDGGRLFSSDKNGIVKVWNVETGEQLLSFSAHQGHESLAAHEGYVQSLAVSHDGKTLASAGGDRLIHVWETESPSPEMIRQRRTVVEAALAVNEARKRLGCVERVVAAIRQDSALSPATARVALEIAEALDETPSSRRRHAAAAIRAGDRQAAAEEIAAAILARFEGGGDGTGDVGNLPAGEWWSPANNEFAAPDKWQVPLEQVVEALSRAVEAQPRLHPLVYVRGLMHARLGHWKVAADDMARAIELVPERSELWHEYAYRLAFVYAWLGDWERYDALCRKTLADFEHTSDPKLADRTAKMCLFSDHIAVDVERVARLADRGVNAGGPDSLVPWLHMAHGIAEYRRGRHADAAATLEKACAGFANGSQYGLAGSSFYLAIVRWRLGDREQARHAYKSGVSILEELPGLESGVGPSWNDRIVADMARREAEALLAGDEK